MTIDPDPSSQHPDDRPRDRHNRPMYLDHEIPPVDCGLAMWRGNVTAEHPPTPANSVSGCHPTDGRRPYATCEHGWVRSGDWWLHCTDCHPPDMDAYQQQVAAVRNAAGRWGTEP